MIEKIEKLKRIDDEIFEEVKKASAHFPWLFKESSIPKTAELLIMYMSSTNCIKSSIFDCAEKEDIYTVKLLFRSMIEHFLRFQYIWFNYTEGGKEEFSSKFYIKLMLSEKLSLMKSTNSVNGIQKKEGKTVDEMWNDLEKIDPRFASYTKPEITKFSESISIKNIIKKLEEYINDNKIEKLNNNTFLTELILRYSTLSSFVHGGIYAHLNVINYERSKKKHDDLIVICGLALQANAFIKLFSFLIFYEVKPEFRDIYTKTQELIKKINN
jgi:hypothetical protein